jgi:alkanesulfonate monooxygenase SsuD/methylene tetrahydromethanopterin reductase-like flavin-dependent oxidoreductase (luciferase family)
MAARLSFGIKTSQANMTYAHVQRIWREADEVDVFEHAWLWDHLVPLRGDVTGPALEAWTLLGALAGQTNRLQLGVMVSSNRLRPPALLAKMAATVDQISGGRLIFGIGAGGSAVANPAGLAIVRREFDALGIPIVPTSEAIEALDETCQITERLWTEDSPFDFVGRWYQLRGAICEPKPIQSPRPQILIGAGGRKSLGVVARHADIWNVPTGGDLRALDQLNGILAERCAEIGRDHTEIRRSVQLLITTKTTSDAVPAGVLPNILDAGAARTLIPALAEAGVSDIVLALVDRDEPRPASWLASEIVEPVLAAAA